MFIRSLTPHNRKLYNNFLHTNFLHNFPCMAWAIPASSSFSSYLRAHRAKSRIGPLGSRLRHDLHHVPTVLPRQWCIGDRDILTRHEWGSVRHQSPCTRWELYPMEKLEKKKKGKKMLLRCNNSKCVTVTNNQKLILEIILMIMITK